MKRKIIITLVAIMLVLTACSDVSKVEYSGEYPAFNSQLDSDGADKTLDDITSEVYGDNDNQSSDAQIDTDDEPEQVEEMKGVWISFLEYEWALKGKTKEQFTNNITEIFEKCVDLELNTVVVQMRSHGDAYYDSEIYPTSESASGIYGIPIAYDPLEIMVELAHSMGLEIHAWINPFRLSTSENMDILSEDYKIKQWYKNPEYMQMDESNTMWYLNPANEEVITLITDGVREIAENYDIDAMHIDDYFYVLPPDKFGHSESVAKEATSTLVKAIYDTVKSVDSSIEFGISPAGGYSEVPNSDIHYYTDLLLWCTTEGYIDYVVPQIYWEYDHETAPFVPTMEKWEALLKDSHAKLYIGLAAYKFAENDILNQQIETVSDSNNSDGYVLFRYDNIK